MIKKWVTRSRVLSLEKDWRCNSVVEFFHSVCKALGLKISSSTHTHKDHIQHTCKKLCCMYPITSLSQTLTSLKGGSHVSNDVLFVCLFLFCQLDMIELSEKKNHNFLQWWNMGVS